jgi:hypothetical protein
MGCGSGRRQSIPLDCSSRIEGIPWASLQRGQSNEDTPADIRLSTNSAGEQYAGSNFCVLCHGQKNQIGPLPGVRKQPAEAVDKGES